MEQKIKLQFPFTHDGHTYSELTMRRPKVRDRRLADKPGSSDADKEIRLVANLCGVTDAVIDEMDAVDYQLVQVALQGFFASATKA